jgi:hypothetical protein
VEAGLNAVGLRIGNLVMFRLDLIQGRHDDPHRIALLSADWDMTTSQLWIYAVPSERRADAHEIMIREALPAAYGWLADLPRRGNAWSATRHSFAVFLVGRGLAVDETWP